MNFSLFHITRTRLLTADRKLRNVTIILRGVNRSRVQAIVRMSWVMFLLNSENTQRTKQSALFYFVVSLDHTTARSSYKGIHGLSALAAKAIHTFIL